MGFLSGITDSLFGDDGKKQSRRQNQENIANREFIREGTDAAKAEIDKYWPQAQADRLFGYQGAQDIMQQFVPQQMAAFQQGNQQAQGTVGATPQQQYNARMGLPVDYGFLQPQQQFQPNFDFLNQPLQAQQPDPAQAQPQAQDPFGNMTQEQIQEIISGLGGQFEFLNNSGGVR